MTTQTKNISAPLEGIRVLDLGRYQAGPRCALMFARMGAEVIKIEGIDGDESRKNGPTVRGQSAYWVQYNSGKKSLAINLRDENGKKVLGDLVKMSDVLIQNFRPGTIDKMGFGYQELKKLNKKIIMVNVSAYGQYGPYKDRVGFDPIGQAISGMMLVNGEEDAPPARTSFPLIDRITSLHATIGALAALREREFSGEGQTIDVCLADTGYTCNEIPITAYLEGGLLPEREGNGKGTGGCYETKDGYVIIAATNENMWERLCDSIQKPEWLEDKKFQTRSDRSKNTSELEAGLQSWFIEHTMSTAVGILSNNGVPCSPVNSTPQAAEDPHLKAREILVEVTDPIAGSMHVSGKMIKFGRTEMVVGPTPMIGEHSQQILRDILGYSDEKISELSETKTINFSTKTNNKSHKHGN